MKIKWRKWVRLTHRDLGYFFFALTVIYSVSGIAVNHLKDWNPNYIIESKQFQIEIPGERSQISKQTVLDILSKFNEEDNYKKHYFPGGTNLKIFIDGGNFVIDLQTGEGTYETVRRRPVFHTFNYLHYNPGKWWIWVADIYAGALTILAFTGLFMIKGKKGFKRRGSFIALLGLILPVLFLILFY